MSKLSISKISSSYGNIRSTQNYSSSVIYKYNNPIITSSSFINSSHPQKTKSSINKFQTKKTQELISNLLNRRLERERCIEIISNYISFDRYNLEGGSVDPTQKEEDAYDKLALNEFHMEYLKNFKSKMSILDRFAAAKKEKNEAF